MSEPLTHQPAELYRVILVAALVGLAILILAHLLLSVIRRKGGQRRPPLNWWERLVYLGTLASVAVLGVTAFVSVLRFGAMHGWNLFVHMFGAGAFVAVLPLLALTWCEPSRFGQAQRDVNAVTVGVQRFHWLPKLMFWLLLVSGFVVTMTMLVSMLHWLETDRLGSLLDLHRYSGLLVVVAATLHLYGVVLQRFQLR